MPSVCCEGQQPDVEHGSWEVLNDMQLFLLDSTGGTNKYFSLPVHFALLHPTCTVILTLSVYLGRLLHPATVQLTPKKTLEFIAPFTFRNSAIIQGGQCNAYAYFPQFSRCNKNEAVENARAGCFILPILEVLTDLWTMLEALVGFFRS